MSSHAIRNLHGRGGDVGNPDEFVADVTCSCATVFTSDTQTTREAAEQDVLAQHAVHAAAEQEAGA